MPDDIGMIDETVAGNQNLLDMIIGQIADGINSLLGQIDELCKRCGKTARKTADTCCKNMSSTIDKLVEKISSQVSTSIGVVNNTYNVLVQNDAVATWLINNVPGFAEYLGIGINQPGSGSGGGPGGPGGAGGAGGSGGQFGIGLPADNPAAGDPVGGQPGQPGFGGIVPSPGGGGPGGGPIVGFPGVAPGLGGNLP